jgi:Rha family phage regulatory protein
VADTQLIRQNGNRLYVTSLDLSNRFEQPHKDVLRDIESLDCSERFRRRNFALTQYHKYSPTDGQVAMPMYEITRDGFAILCMCFTGAAAARWRERYIEAYSRAERALFLNYIASQTAAP